MKAQDFSPEAQNILTETIKQGVPERVGPFHLWDSNTLAELKAAGVIEAAGGKNYWQLTIEGEILVQNLSISSSTKK